MEALIEAKNLTKRFEEGTQAVTAVDDVDISIARGELVVIMGESGSGKTTFAYVILGNFLLKEKPFVVFDWKKSFRAVLNVNKNVLCYTVGNEKIANYFRKNI